MKILKFAVLLPTLIQVLSELVNVVEDAALSGEEKRKAVIDGFVAVWNGILLEAYPKWARYPMETVIRTAGRLVDALVQMKHAVGLFNAGPAPV